MADKAKAAEAKAKGNTAFQAKDYSEAITHFTEAIGHDPTDHVFFSNRSACYASLERYDDALSDGTRCVELKPDWPKGYTRKGLAQFFLEKYDDAADTYKAGLKLAPEDPTLKEGLKKAMDGKYDVWGSGAGGGKGSGGGGGGGGGLFGKFDPAALAAAAAKNPKIAEYTQDKDLMQKLQMLNQLGGANSQMQQGMLMQLMQQDPRMLELVMAMQGIDISTMEEARGEAAPGAAPSSRPAPKAAPKKEEPPPDDRTPEQIEADDFKKQGNELYKQKQFAEALEKYDEAIRRVPDDLVYYNNKCAVWIEMGEEHYDQVLETCQDLINRRYEINGANPGGASFEKVAKVFLRMASVYEKRKEFDQAIEYYNKSLTEDSTRQTRSALAEAKRAKEKYERDSYLNPELAEEAREKGNTAFKQSNWAEAKREYDEAIKRNPTDAKLYSNRAAALTKLMAHPDALRDLDECLKLDPTFVKAYSRKGTCHFFMKEYHKALQAYENGLKMEPGNEECIKGREQVVHKISETSREAPDEEQIRHAMADPEIQQIMKDPNIKLFLQSMEENPKAANERLQKDIKLQEAVSKLMAAGILRTSG